ncbi:MAG: hypothetical protein OYH76_12555 [Defluviicoccus sp.]|nr:hypothetical protein [Defluviicoccus sp.]MDE0276719.1 hypothetical protein [Defluviicoccus sp.]
MSLLPYAGIGARRTPREVLEKMTVAAAWLSRRGWHLHSGGARGADSAFAAGAPENRRTLHLPWPGYEGHRGTGCHIPAGDVYRKCIEIASGLHPAWHRCTDGARRLHARNVSILLGEDLVSPVLAAIAWTPGGRPEGGTGMGIRIAEKFGIPHLNFGSMHPRTICERMEELRAAYRL